MSERLIIPSAAWTKELTDLRNELRSAGENLEGSSRLNSCDDIGEWLDHVKQMSDPDKLPAGIVPATQYIYVREEDRRIIGVIQLRHYLDRSMEMFFGQISYGVRPSERRKGYAAAMLKDLLQKCRRMGLQKVLITCEESNEASRRTILSNGGVYDSTVYMLAMDINIERYWIEL